MSERGDVLLGMRAREIDSWPIDKKKLNFAMRTSRCGELGSSPRSENVSMYKV